MQGGPQRVRVTLRDEKLEVKDSSAKPPLPSSPPSVLDFR
jgi:hypothetical protein